MKIVFINDGIYKYAINSPVAFGGAERYQWLLARALVRRGWSVSVGVQIEMQDRERHSIEGVRFIRLRRQYPLRAYYNFLESEQPDWWYWQCADHKWGPAVEMAKYFRIGTIFSAALDRDVQPRKALYSRPYCWPLYGWGLLRSDKIFVQHRGQLTQLPRLLQRKASILPGIVDIPGDVVSHIKREKYVAWVAVLRKVKRADLLVEIARKAPNLRFVVCGGPSEFMSPPGYGEWIVNALCAQPNIEYLGTVPPQKTLEIIARSAMLLSTSDEEGFPSVFLEAWSAGTPVISLKIDPDDIIQDYGLGAIAGNIETAVLEIKALMGSPIHRESISERARRYVSQQHSESAVAAVFDRALQGAHSKRHGLAREDHIST